GRSPRTTGASLRSTRSDLHTHMITRTLNQPWREDGHRTFGLMELAVRGPWRGQGVARRLHEALLDGINAERVLLNVHPDSKAASSAYRAWGYRKIGEARPWEGPDLYDVMLLDLRTANHVGPGGGRGGPGRDADQGTDGGAGS
ncbi:GNAT family N-acetyltransferase, partial [Streptomyces sp. NPDC005071]